MRRVCHCDKDLLLQVGGYAFVGIEREVSMTVAPAARAIACVPSVLPESTIIHWFAKRTLSRQAWILSASFRVMMMTDSFMEQQFALQRF
jgi:hypothetical protein